MNVEPIKQMQPHVVIRPRPNLLAAKKQVKRQFVTTHQLQQQQKNKKARQLDSLKPPQGGTRKSPRLNKMKQISDATVCQKPTSARRKLDLKNPPHADETMGENDPEGSEVGSEDTILPPPPPITEYEIQRAIRVKENNQVFLQLNLPSLSAGMRNSVQRKKGKEKMADGNEDYDPGEDVGSDGDVSVTPPKETKKTNKRKLLMGRGPTTRSRANAPAKPGTEDTSQKEGTCPSPLPGISANPFIELPQAADAGNGSMADFFAMRKRQQEEARIKKAKMEKAEKQKAEMEEAKKGKVDATTSKKVVMNTILTDIEEGDIPVPQRMRGKTRMDKVHMRSLDKRLVIGMNEFFQPITENDKVLSELSSFLGTLAKRCVSLTYVTWRHVPENLRKTMWNYVKARYIIPDELKGWVIESIHASSRGYKGRIKEAHFTAFDNDEMRLENRPDDIPLESFKMLLEYWNDETVQEKAKKNSARKSYTDTHTRGPKSFAQIRHKMKKINEELSTGDAHDELLSDRKHGPQWLLGRCVKPSKVSSSNAPTDTYVNELTSKIKQGLAAEVEEKVKQIQAEVDEQVNKKVQQNLASVLKKLGEANPNITINIEELCVTAMSDDDGTPITGGSSF
ncbi:hypothetical protein POM88_001970 [Heracleum sosnowskyi]|uniref:Uncharacterized protein n=1 Tax=Heracleum sosnowskyi TaxID=360622 RepID=A0AAD8JDA7_9APIA|nr:hypothetical protein POM88_001970 [Heracleum sosnowskyi]